jgi:hypothetical protein
VVLVVGGSREVLCQDKDKIDLVILKRKGFVKKALQHGSDLVPTFSFGEAFLYNAMWPNPIGSWTRTIQEYIVTKTRWPFPFFIGRCIFQYTFGNVPHRHPINVVGKKEVQFNLNLVTSNLVATCNLVASNLISPVF